MSNSNKFQFLSGDDFNKLVGDIATKGAEMNRLIQLACVNAIGQSIVHRNIDPAKRLYQGLANGTRKDAVLAYLEINGNIEYSKKANGLVFVERVKADGFDGDALMEKNWNDAKKEAAPKSIFDVEQELESLLKRLSKRIEKGDVEVRNQGLIALVEATRMRYIAETYLGESAKGLTEKDKADPAISATAPTVTGDAAAADANLLGA